MKLGTGIAVALFALGFVTHVSADPITKPLSGCDKINWNALLA